MKKIYDFLFQKMEFPGSGILSGLCELVLGPSTYSERHADFSHLDGSHMQDSVAGQCGMGSDVSLPAVNPATGLAMVGNTDTAGNPCGTSSANNHFGSEYEP